MTEPTISHIPGFWVLGLQERIRPMAADYGAIWRRAEERYRDVVPLAADENCYGVYFGTDQEGVVDFLAGRPVAPGSSAPDGLTVREIGAGDYAVFTCGMREIGPTWQSIFAEWLPACGYAYDAARPAYEAFPPGCHEGEAPVRVHVPVMPKG